MGKGYAEGSAVEERLAALERGDDPDRREDAGRAAVYGSTDDQPEQHFIGWLDDVDPDALFGLPFVEQVLDMTPLRVVEVHAVDDAPCLGGVVVRDRRLEALTLRRRLPQLSPEPTEEGDRLGARHNCFSQIVRRWSVTKPRRS